MPPPITTTWCLEACALALPDAVGGHMTMRSMGKIDAFERSLDRYDLFEALGTPSVVCARGCVPRGPTSGR